MVDAHWRALDGEELRYNGNRWKLSGDVEILQSGDLLGVEAKEVDGVRHRTAVLYFEADRSEGSLNPADDQVHVHDVEREDGSHVLVVGNDHRSYRYQLHRIEYP